MIETVEMDIHGQGQNRSLTNLPYYLLRNFLSKKIPSSLRDSVSHAVSFSNNFCFCSLKSIISDLISTSINDYNAAGKLMR